VSLDSTGITITHRSRNYIAVMCAMSCHCTMTILLVQQYFSPHNW